MPTTHTAAPSGVNTAPDAEAAPTQLPWRRCLQRLVNLLSDRLADVLARAEKRVTQNFRVPPGGG